MRIPRSVRDLQVERESLFWDFSSQRLFHGLGLFFRQWRQQFSFRAVMSDAMSCDHQRQGSVQVLMDDHLASGQGGAPLGVLDLHDQVVKAYGVVLINGALVSLREDQLQVPVPTGYECRSALRCRIRGQGEFERPLQGSCSGYVERRIRRGRPGVGALLTP